MKKKLDGVLQYQLSNGIWVDCDERTNEFLNRCVQHDYRDYTMDQVIDILNGGGRVRNNSSGWYSNCRIKPVICNIDQVKCDCGHTVMRESVMYENGTVCPGCYN